MAGFLYFLAGGPSKVTLEATRQLGLGYAFTGSCASGQCNSNNPVGKAGCIFADRTRHVGREIGMYPDRQTWRKMPAREGRPELWLGYWSDAKPTPRDLLRANAPEGIVVLKLFDGQDWIIPAFTEFDETTHDGPCALPAALDYDEAGNLIDGKPVGEFAALWESIHPVALGLCFGTDGPDAAIRPPTDEDIRVAAIKLLTAKYVVDIPELVALGALSNEAALYSRIVMACCRGRWLLEAIDDLKKNEDRPPLSGSDTTPGGED